MLKLLIQCERHFGRIGTDTGQRVVRDALLKEVILTLQADAIHCGKCDNTCPAFTPCVGGICGSPCPPGLSPCNGTCVMLNTDPKNCGKAGNVVPSAAHATTGCRNGLSTIISCAKGYSDKDKKFANGCEARLKKGVRKE